MDTTAFIHTFSTSQGKYIYDVNTDKVLKVPEEVYSYFNNGEKNMDVSSDTIKYIENLKNNGFLKSNRVYETEHPATELLSSYIENNLKYLILQVTQNCNLRCDYCVYSGGYHNRTHCNKRMDLDTAKKGIDYLIKHSKNSKDLTLGFYGGEPLLEFELIKECVKYVEEQAQGKRVTYNMTTNGTLLNDKILDFLVKKNFIVSISLDGPEKVHNRNRKFVSNNKGSFSVIIKNLESIEKKYPDFLKKNVNINSVLTTEDGFECINNFFSKHDCLNKINITCETVNTILSKNEIKISEKYIEENLYEQFKLYLSKLGRYNPNKVSILLKKDLDKFDNLKIIESNTRHELPKKWHHGGPCIPGFNRLFLNVDGELFPCEKVCETAEFAKIGHIDNGIDLDKASAILNIENVNKEKCYNCWIYSHCFLCAHNLKDLDVNSCNELDEECSNMRFNIEEGLKDYCTLKECGYDLDIDMYGNF